MATYGFSNVRSVQRPLWAVLPAILWLVLALNTAQGGEFVVVVVVVVVVNLV